MTMLLKMAASFIVSYLFGSISFSIVISRLIFHDDIRNHGSGNAGMTNILRTYGIPAAAGTLIGDFLKGFIGVQISKLILAYGVSPDVAATGGFAFMFRLGLYVAAAGALLGHLHPIYFGFKGGKGVSVTMGALFSVNPIGIVLATTFFLIIAFTTKIVSLASILAACSYAVITFVMHYGFGQFTTPDLIAAVLFPAVIIYAHRTNIKRLLNGTEYKFGQKK